MMGAMTADRDALNTLLRIQDLDSTLDALRHQRATLPEFDELASTQAEAAEVDAAAAVVQEERHDLERSQKRYEDEVALLEDRINAENAKLYGGDVTGMKDLQALQDEIAGLGDRRTLVEDQILEIMEAAEPVDAKLADFAQQKTALDQRGATIENRITQRQSEIDGEIGDTEGQRSDHAAAISAELLAEYERIRSQPGTVGVAKLVGSTCHGCHLELPAVEVDRLKKLPADELVHCEECGCILVRT